MNTDSEQITYMENIDYKLQVLRERYLKEPRNRKIIEVQARLLKAALAKRKKSVSFKEAEAIFT